MKPGYKTSEFWLSLLVVLLGSLMASGIVADGGMVAKIVGGILSALAALGYTSGRSSVKKAESASVAYVTKAANDNEANEGLIANPTKESA